MAVTTPPPPQAVTSHPLDPLTPDEMSRAAAITRRDRSLGGSARFVYLSLREPPKPAILDYDPAEPPEREAAVLVYHRDERMLYEGVASLTDDALVAWRPLPGRQPPLMFEEFIACEQIVKADARWREAMRLRGVTDFELAMVDPWPAGNTGPQDDPGRRRVARPLTFLRSKPDDNGYGRPVEGLVVEVDLDAMEVVAVEDHGVVPLPPQPGNYVPSMMVEEGNVPAFDGLREDARPIEIVQPEGSSFTLDGRELSWQKWRLRVGFTPREGIVLHQVGYEDHGELRPVLYRASLSEMYIPYGDPAPTHWRKNVFDEGECGLGVLANPLALGCDCLGEITYLDGVVNDQNGEPVLLENAICIHEEDVGIAWKHTDFRTEKGEVRRLRRLVISSIATVGNYEYGFFWHLYTDGSIEYEVKLTGVISTGALAPGEKPTHGTVVAPGLYGPHHQHFFCARLDMCVDGPSNSVWEMNSRAIPVGPENPHGNAWVVEPTLLASEAQAQRRIDPFSARQWKVANGEKRNATGEPVAYTLRPGENCVPFFAEGSQQARRGAFAQQHLWVTAYDHGELFAAGDYPNQHPGGDGLPAYAAADRPLEDADVVLWYVFGAHHVVRPEDWPVMPVNRIGFHLKPTGFFDGNPNLDLPPSAAACHAHVPMHQEVRP